MNHNILKSTTILIGSLLGYRLAKNSMKVERIPAMLVGGFLGNVIAELFNRKNKQETQQICNNGKKNETTTV